MSDEAVSISISMPSYCLGKTPFCLLPVLGKIQFFPPALLLYLYIHRARHSASGPTSKEVLSHDKQFSVTPAGCPTI